MSRPKVSIIIRTKNEERWINLCLGAVFEQDFKDFEVIVVDNLSKDGTLHKIKQFKVKLVTIKDYKPGLAINEGIRASSGEILVILSGHCIPTNKTWLSHLIRNFQDTRIAGVYGRQLPMSFSSNKTKRDLLITFGLDRIEHIKDSFFHNANSAIRRTIWKKIPFDEEVTNIEDRIWADQVLKMGYRTVYEPDASVYHYHGIHHDDDVNRLNNTLKVIETKTEQTFDNANIDFSRHKCICLIPHTGPVIKYKGQPLIHRTISYAIENQMIDKTIFLTDNRKAANIAEKCGAVVPFLRNSEFSKAHIDLSMVYSHYFGEIEKKGVVADIVVSLEPEYIWRPPELINNLIHILLMDGYDSVLPVIKEDGMAWLETEKGFKRADSGSFPRPIKPSMYISVKGLGFVTHSEFIRSGNMYGNHCGILPIDYKYSSLRINQPNDIKHFENLINKGAIW